MPESTQTEIDQAVALVKAAMDYATAVHDQIAKVHDLITVAEVQLAELRKQASRVSAEVTAEIDALIPKLGQRLNEIRAADQLNQKN